MKYEIINPSDQAFMHHYDPKVAIAATLVLGGGYYGLISEKGDRVLPVIAFGGSGEFLDQTFGGKQEFEVFLNSHRKEMVEALDSVHLSGERTSINDIQLKAKGIAAKYKEILAKETATATRS